MRHTVFKHHIPTLMALALAIASVAFHVGTAQAADRSAAQSIEQQDRANCEAGRTQQDRATCLKEAGAAAEERKRQGLVNTGSARLNATERCKALPVQDRADCLARIEGTASPNQQITTRGSVATGGVLRETRTTTVGPLPGPASAPAPAPASTPLSAASAPR